MIKVMDSKNIIFLCTKHLLIWPNEPKTNGAVTYKRIKVTDAKQTENLPKNVYPVMEVVSVVVNVDAEVVRSAYILNNYGQRTAH